MMKIFRFLLSTVPFFAFSLALSQTASKKVIDTFPATYLKDITLVGLNSTSDIQQMPEVVGTGVYAGKKSSLVVLKNVQGNIVTNTMRQVLAKVPGVHVWENDGSGIQIGIASRGLSPNRSWEFNIRQNGYDIAADPFGYPEAYYNPQLQSVQRMEIVRGHGALQYGPQFGGMVNYILRNGADINKPLQVETQQTAGSNGLLNSYLAVGGESERYHYYAFYDNRKAEGWRTHSRYFTHAGFATLTRKWGTKLSITAEFMRSHIRSQQPGGLTDAQMQANARQSLRARNWFDVEWTTAALIANYNFSNTTRLNVKLFHVSGDRSSVGFLKAITIHDSINPQTLQYDNRVVDIDLYRNYGIEARVLTNYTLLKKQNTLSGGVRWFKGNTRRFKNGKGTTGSDYDVQISGLFPQQINLNTYNGAVFLENIFRFSERFIVVPGIRAEFIKMQAGGRLSFNSDGTENLSAGEERTRSFLLAGIGAEYHLNNQTELYANCSQAYRPMLFSDLTYAPTTDVVDANLKDAKGFNADIGYRGKPFGWLFADLSFFWMQYNNRIGTLTQQRTDGSFYNYRTNVGNSRSCGVEALAEANLMKAFNSKSAFGLTAFCSFSYTDARYESFKVIVKEGNTLKETSLRNNRVENAPFLIIRSGITASYKLFSLSAQYSYTGNSFSDANNTLVPSANGQNGLLPSYGIYDLHGACKLMEKVNVKAGINNLGDLRYFTRRSGGYPGPGLLPADGRTFFVSLEAAF